MDEPRQPATPDEAARLHRRRFIGAGALGAAGAVATAAAIPLTLAQQEAAGSAAPGTPQAAASQPLPGYLSLSPFQAGVLEAACERLIPGDALGPGAKEAGVVVFIDRALANEQAGFRGPYYRQGPFAAGEATQGDQSMLTMRERFRLGILGLEGEARARYGQGFAALAGDQQDAILSDLEQGKPESFGSSSLTAPPTEGAPGSPDGAAPSPLPARAFFAMLLSYTQAGFFADPAYGGNLGMAGWKLIGFPGAQMGYAGWIGRHGETFTGKHQSLADVQGFGHHEGS